MSPEPESTAELLEDRVVSLPRLGRRSTRPAGRWVLLAAGLAVALGAAILSARPPLPPLAAVAPPSPGASLSAPTPLVAATDEPTATPESGPCGTGRIQFHPNAEPLPRQDVAGLRVPKGGMMALTTGDSTDDGSLLLASARDDASGTTAASVIATFTGTAIQPGRSVTPISWSADGQALLVSAGHRSTSVADEDCNDLVLLQSTGTEVTASSLTDNRSGSPAVGGALSPDGSRVAYLQQNELRVVDIHGSRPGQVLDRCEQPLGAARWSPDGNHLLAICNRSIEVIDMTEPSGGTFSVASFSSALNALLMTAGWTPDSGSIVTIAAQTGQMVSSALEIAEIDAVTGSRTERSVSPTNTQWVVGSSSMSPDGRWALVQGSDSYAIDTATGTATNLPWIVLPTSFDPVAIAWLADGDTFLYGDAGTLYEVDLAAMTRTEVGAVPASAFAWYEPVAFTPATQ